MAISIAIEETGEVAENTPVNKGAIGFLSLALWTRDLNCLSVKSLKYSKTVSRKLLEFSHTVNET